MAIGAPEVKKRLGVDTVVYGAIRARSGLTSKGIDVFHGTIDSDYRGEILVLIRNNTNAEFEIERGDKIAQLIFSVALVPTLIDYEKIETVFETARGDGGFGSTGVKSATDASLPDRVAPPPKANAAIVVEYSDSKV
jgi:deoxyuridine 5'-triphosphate nucleotidohydrolase